MGKPRRRGGRAGRGGVGWGGTATTALASIVVRDYALFFAAERPNVMDERCRKISAVIALYHTLDGGHQVCVEYVRTCLHGGLWHKYRYAGTYYRKLSYGVRRIP